MDHGYESFYLLTQAWMSMLYTVLITSEELLLINILRAPVYKFHLQVCKMKQIENSQTWPECTCRSSGTIYI